MQEVLSIGKIIKIFADTISLSSFNEADGPQFYQANKKQIQRMKEYDIDSMNEKDFSNYINFIKKINAWAEWAKKEGYLKGFQQTAISDFYMIMNEAASINMPLDKNMAEHFFCYAIAKVLYNQVQEYMKVYPDEDKYKAMYWTFTAFDFFGDDDSYLTDFTPLASTFSLLTKWVKDINKVINYWEEKIASSGKRENPPNLKAYIKNWKNGVSPSWNIIKLFFDNDLCPPDDFFIDDDLNKKDIYKTFKANLYLSFVLTNLFDSLEKEGILLNESRVMIRTGTRLYYRDFYVKREHDNSEYSETFETTAKENLMFRTLFCMLDATLYKSSTIEYLSFVYEHPEFPKLLD